MKNAATSSLTVLLFIVSCLLVLNFTVSGQESSKMSPALPDDVNKIVTASCMPCHTSTGGLLSRSKLNFTKWTEYSATKQKERAEKMYSELKKGAMPPKSARETRPEIVPTKEQLGIIKKWAESFESGDK